MILEKLTPRVDRKVLMTVAGLMRCGVGVMLIRYAFTWLSVLQIKTRIIFGLTGIIASIPIHLYGFSKIAAKNLQRLIPVTEKRCLFSFITWKSYLIVIFMIALGITLRHSSIPKQYLSIVYNGIGFALFLSGTKYLRLVLTL
jgi:hypothetical protein